MNWKNIKINVAGTEFDVPDLLIVNGKSSTLPPISIHIDDVQIPENEQFDIKELSPFNYEIEIKDKLQLITLLKRLGVQLNFGSKDSPPISISILPDSYLDGVNDIQNLVTFKKMISKISRKDWETVKS